MSEQAEVYPGASVIAGMPCRVRVPQGAGPHPLLVMLHGYQGNEDVTWIFTRAAGPEWMIASPRAPLPAEPGYSWYRFIEGKTDPDSLHEGLETLRRFMDGLKAAYPVDTERVVLLGFSQGAAVAYAYAILGNTVAGVVSLGGFLPGGGVLPKPLPPLNSLPILILHGEQDETISVELARKNQTQLNEAGAAVTYQEENVGHRVGPKGMRLLTEWLAARR